MTIATEQDMKVCTRCEQELPVTEFGENRATEDGLNRQCRECVRECQQVRQAEVAERYQRFCEMHRTEIGEQKRKHGRANTTKAIAAREYRCTFAGCLHSRFWGMMQRCNDPWHKDYKYYGAKGVRCFFASANEFINYVILSLELFVYADIEGKQIHRIDPDGHYEPDNIEFLTRAEHAAKHREMRDYNAES